MILIGLYLRALKNSNFFLKTFFAKMFFVDGSKPSDLMTCPKNSGELWTNRQIGILNNLRVIQTQKVFKYDI